MTELINKEELLRRFADFGREIPKDIVIGVIASVKEDIVRCKDCEYIGKVGDVSVCRIHEISTRADDYCSRGERSDE